MMSTASFARTVLFDEYREEIKQMTLDGHRPLTSYSQSRKYVMQNIHLDQDHKGYFVRDVYCLIQYRERISPNTMPDHTKINIEHTWPQSRFNRSESRSYQKADLHHLYPTNSRANSTRGNHYFNQFKNGQVLSHECQASSVGTISQTGARGFEPPEEHKGNVARALFYFALRYNMRIPAYEEFFLRQWHLIDPVDSDELARNDFIETVQGNRNPFIDDPDLAQLIEDF
tara:strand:+ start:2504 stop:3190 length:687 start_codon:yes stop_codon:yes gene_type:complete